LVASGAHGAEGDVGLLEDIGQCANGREPNAMSRIAASWAEFAISFAGSLNRASDNRSGRPIPLARAGSLSGVTTSRNQLSSEVRYTFHGHVRRVLAIVHRTSAHRAPC
jgi:hypothetical protein